MSRKSRLNKGGGSEFIGFNAFGDGGTNTFATATTKTPTATTTTTTASSSSSSTKQWSPVYMGSNSQVGQYFQWIGQKRDATTKVKALIDLSNYFLNQEESKKSQIDALSHLLYLFHSKLYYDSVSTVRAEALSCLLLYAKQRLPKAFATLASQKDYEIWGMMYCAYADPAAEVRAVLTKFDNNSNNDNNTVADFPDWDINATTKGIWAYAQRILSYGRPTALHEALFSITKKSNNDQKQQQQQQQQTDYSDRQREEMEERYERIVGTAISGLQLFISKHGSPNNNNNDNNNDIVELLSSSSLSLWMWKSMTSPKASLRRKTYTLLSTCCCSNNTTLLVDTAKIEPLLTQAISVEKESNNIPPLLETLLSYLANITMTIKSKNSLVKQLVKVFKKGCHGASATQWSMTVLPLIAMLTKKDDTTTTKNENDNNNKSLETCTNLVSAVWEGRSACLSHVDKLSVCMAVAETVTFCVIKRNEVSSTLLKIWLEVFQFYTTKKPTTRIVQAAHDKLGNELAKNVLQFHQQTTTTTTTTTVIPESFWQTTNDQNEPSIATYLTIQNDNKQQQEEETLQISIIANWIRQLQQQQQQTIKIVDSSPLSTLEPILCTLFHESVIPFEGASGAVPTTDAYDLWKVLLDYVGVQTIFTNASSIEKFIMNNLLRWMVIHTSTLSERNQEEFAVKDFELFYACNQPTLWESVLRELIAAKCDLATFVTGLNVLLSLSSSSSSSLSSSWTISHINCPTLEDFAIRVGKEAIEHHHNDNDNEDGEDSMHTDALEELYHKTGDFLQTCVGLGDVTDKPIVGPRVVEEWIDCACPKDKHFFVGPNPVLETLVLLLLQHHQQETEQIEINNNLQKLITDEQMQLVLIQSWQQGGVLWEESCSPLLSKNKPLMLSIIDKMSCELKNSLQQTQQEVMSMNLVADLSLRWSEQASRTLALCNSQVKDSNNNKSIEIPKPSLTLIGLDNLDLWRLGNLQTLHVMYFALMSLLYELPDTKKRLALFENSIMNSVEFFVDLLFALSEASNDILVSDSVRNRTDHCAQLLSAMSSGGGGETCQKGLLQDNISIVHDWCEQCIVSIFSLLQGNGPTEQLQRGIAVLSQLLSILYKPLSPGAAAAAAAADDEDDGDTTTQKQLQQDINNNNDNDDTDKVDPSKLNKGDTVWYITNSENPNIREPATIVKVHTDLPSELYFTISVKRDEQVQERQTVAQRLRLTESAPITTTSDDNGAAAAASDAANDAASAIVVKKIPNKFESENSISVDDLSDMQRKERMNMSNKLIQQLVKPWLESLQPSCAAELLNILLSQCGLFGETGLGTTRYEIFSKLVSMQASIICSFEKLEEENNNNMDSIAESLWKLSLVFGFGCNTPSHDWNMKLLRFDPTDSVNAIIKYYNDPERTDTSLKLDRSVVSWLIVATLSIQSTRSNGEIRDKAVSLLFLLAEKLLTPNNNNNNDSKGFKSDHLLALKAIHVAQLASHDTPLGGSTVQDDEARALVAVVNSFASDWETTTTTSTVRGHAMAFFQNNDGRTPVVVWDSLPYFSLILDASLKHRYGFIATAAKLACNDIVTALVHESKRPYCLVLLDAFASVDTPLFDNPEDSINDTTAKRLKSWCMELTDEEGEELEEDVGAAAQWIPSQLMNEIETWYEQDGSTTNNNNIEIITHRFIAWLALLRIIEAATPRDPLNHASFNAYISKCQAVDYILTTVLDYLNIGKNSNNNNNNIDKRGNGENNNNNNDNNSISQQMEDLFTFNKYNKNNDKTTTSATSLLLQDVSTLAPIVLFRTIELFSTMSKHWWEFTCPKYFTQSIQEFVKIHVSPEMLRRELNRIQSSTTLLLYGTMKVVGSLKSREVTATYIQDDFTLTVVIYVPISFPFRSAQVDCSKTLGIPEKRWKRWSLQITQMLNHQGGSIQDALLLWKENVDKEFEGVEPCPVCYCVLHVKSHKLPEMECKTCHNRFHFDCLTQWFKSSGKSACVLCQQPWSGTRV